MGPTRTANVRVAGDSIESYFLIRAGANDSAINPGQQNIVTNVTKIDASGAMIWNYKYYTPLTGKNQELRDYPTAAVWVDTFAGGKGNFCFIAGGHYGRDTAFKNTGEHYCFGIDLHGAIVQPYTFIDAPGLPYNHDAVFDPQGGRYPIAMTWSLGGSKIDTGKLGGANTLLGFMRLDDNLAPLFQSYYRTDSATRNEGVRISLADSASYLIGANTYHA